MAGGFLPDARHGRDLYARIAHRLAGSYAHVFDACGAVCRLDQPALAAHCDAIRAASRVRPDLFILHADAVDAACRSDPAAIRAAADAFLAAAVAAPDGLRLRGWDDASFSAGEAARYRWAFAESGDTRVTLVPPKPAAFARACDALTAARAALAVAAPALHGEIEALVGEVVFAAGRIGATMTFDGISSFNAFGALVLNAAEHASVPGALAGYVHEAAHLLLFAHTEGRELVDNGPEAIHPSPLRADPRPMDGIFHATFVSARMAYALERALGSDALAASDRDEAARLLAGARRAFTDGLGVVRAAGRPTVVGRALIDAAAAAMDRAA